MNVTVSYLLSQAGQKASLLAGGTGQQQQTITLAADDPLLPQVVALGEIDTAGNLLWNASKPVSSLAYYSFDQPQTVQSLLEYHAARRLQAQAAEQARLAEIHAATLQVLQERKVTRSHQYARAEAGSVSRNAVWESISPAWSYYRDQSVVESEEAKAWEAELEAQNQQAKAQAELEAQQKLQDALAEQARAQAEKEAKESARQAWRTANDIADDDLPLRVEDGALVSVPPDCWESHSRGKNWLAIISSNPSQPGGLEREFQPKAKGDYYYLTSGLAAGQALEFGADYYSGSGRKSSRRWYGVVVAIRTLPRFGGAEGETAEYLILREAASGKAASLMAAKVAV